MSVSYRNPLRIRNSGASQLIVVLEPWAEEFELTPGAVCDVVATNPEIPPTFGVEAVDGHIIVSINEGGSNYEFWRDGVHFD